jgi:hypothetical protein
VRRGLAVLVVLSLCSLQVQSLAFHVHGVPDHAEDREHQHGPAIHHHDEFDAARHVDEGELSEGGTVITIAVPAAATSTIVIVHAEFAEALSVLQLQLAGDARAVDVRSHGPPPNRHSFLRGPPASLHS